MVALASQTEISILPRVTGSASACDNAVSNFLWRSRAVIMVNAKAQGKLPLSLTRGGDRPLRLRRGIVAEERRLVAQRGGDAERGGQAACSRCQQQQLADARVDGQPRQMVPCTRWQQGSIVR